MKKFLFVLLCAIMGVIATGCGMWGNTLSNFNESMVGKSATIQTYNEDGAVIDSIRGVSISVNPDTKFTPKNGDGTDAGKSSVLDITVGGKNVTHVGSSLILFEDGLVNSIDEYAKTVDINNTDKSVPFMNRLVNNVKNATTGKKEIILIRSQNGTPLATFTGDSISSFSTSIDKSTGVMIDGKRLFIYRCDYTKYEVSLLTGSDR